MKSNQVIVRMTMAIVIAYNAIVEYVDGSQLFTEGGC